MTVNPDVATRQLPLLGIYLNDHLAGSTSGLELVRRTARARADTAAGPPLRQLASEIAEDRRTLLASLARSGRATSRAEASRAGIGTG